MSPLSFLRVFIQRVFILFSIPNLLFRWFVKNIAPELFGNRIRYWYYKRKFFAYGQDSLIHEGCVIYFPELIKIGSRSSIGRYTELNPGPGEAPCLIVGDDTWLGPYSFFRTANHRFDKLDELFIKQGHEEGKIVLGNDIWGGAHCIYLAGTEIGDHCVIAAGSVVSGKIPPYSIVGGNPARVIRLRK